MLDRASEAKRGIGQERSSDLLARRNRRHLIASLERARQCDGVDPLERAGRRVDLAIHAGLAHPARDQLRELATAIEDQDP